MALAATQPESETLLACPALIGGHLCLQHLPSGAWAGLRSSESDRSTGWTRGSSSPRCSCCKRIPRRLQYGLQLDYLPHQLNLKARRASRLAGLPIGMKAPGWLQTGNSHLFLATVSSDARKSFTVAHPAASAGASSASAVTSRTGILHLGLEEMPL